MSLAKCIWCCKLVVCKQSFYVVEVEYLYNLPICLSVFHHIPAVDYGSSGILKPRCPPPQPHLMKLVLYYIIYNLLYFTCVSQCAVVLSYMMSVWIVLQISNRFDLLIHFHNSTQIWCILWVCINPHSNCINIFCSLLDTKLWWECMANTCSSINLF